MVLSVKRLCCPCSLTYTSWGIFKSFITSQYPGLLLQWPGIPKSTESCAKDVSSSPAVGLSTYKDSSWVTECPLVCIISAETLVNPLDRSLRPPSLPLLLTSPLTFKKVQTQPSQPFSDSKLFFPQLRSIWIILCQQCHKRALGVSQRQRFKDTTGVSDLHLWWEDSLSHNPSPVHVSSTSSIELVENKSTLKPQAPCPPVQMRERDKGRQDTRSTLVQRLACHKRASVPAQRPRPSTRNSEEAAFPGYEPAWVAGEKTRSAEPRQRTPSFLDVRSPVSNCSCFCGYLYSLYSLLAAAGTGLVKKKALQYQC